MKNADQIAENKIQKNLKANADAKISLSASSILQAYHQKEAAPAPVEEKVPLHKRLWFRLSLSLTAASAVAAAVLMAVYWPKGTTDRLYNVPSLSSSSKKLMFEANNLSGCLDLSSSLRGLAPQKALLYEEEDDSESEEEEGTLVLLESDYAELASTYHSLFHVLSLSSDSSGSFTNVGAGYTYTSSSGVSLSLNEDPNNLPASFTATLSDEGTDYALTGSYEKGLLSFDVASSAGAPLSTYKEEVNALRSNRRTFSYSQTSGAKGEKYYFDADFEEAEELDVEMGKEVYASGLLSKSLEFEMEFEESSAEIVCSLLKGEQEAEEIPMTAEAMDSSTKYSFPGTPYSFTLTNL